MKIAYNVEQRDVASQMNGLARHSRLRKVQKSSEWFLFVSGPLLMILAIPERRISALAVAVALVFFAALFRYHRRAKDAAIERTVAQSVSKRVEVDLDDSEVRITLDGAQAAAVPYHDLRKISRLRDGLYVWGGELFWIWLPYRAISDESGAIQAIVRRWNKG